MRADIVVNNLTGTAFTRGKVGLQSDGSPRGGRWSTSRTSPDAFLAVLDAPREVVHDQAFNVGRDEDVVQVRDIAVQVAERMSAPVTFAQGAGPDARDYRVDFAKIKELLPAFQPIWTIADGIDELARDMAAYGLAAEDFEGPRFVRLQRIRELMGSGRMIDDLRIAAVPA